MLILLFQLFFGADILLPHGDLDLKIEAISQLIETYPDSMQLRLKRGDYYVQNEEFHKAKQDYLLCFNRHHKTDYVLIGMTTCYLVEGKTDSALYFINQTLLKAPDNPGAKELKAKVFLSAGRNCDAGNLYSEILSTFSHPAPLLFIEASSALRNCETPGSTEVAILILKDGLTKVPGSKVLQNQLISLYKQEEKIEEALQVQSTMIEQSSFKSRHYIERAKTYLSIGKTMEAKKDLESALASFELLPTNKKDLPAMEDLKNDIQFHLKALEN